MWLLLFGALLFVGSCLPSLEASIVKEIRWNCTAQWSNATDFDPFVTFIIPSSGRQCLARTLNSLYRQSDKRWLAIVVFDGVISSSTYLDPLRNIPIFFSDVKFDNRVCVQHIVKSGSFNCAGQIRNLALPHVTTPWTAFVDDDDTLDEKYVQNLAREIRNNPNLGTVIFRMSTINSIHPNIKLDNFYLGDVGISFALRTRLIQSMNLSFAPSSVEDFLFLNELRSRNISILLSEEVMYYVKDLRPLDTRTKGRRGFIYPVKTLSYNNARQSFSEVDLTKYKTKRCIASVKKMKVPNFIFSEESNPLFSSNIQGLRVSLERAVDRGCLGSWSLGPIDIGIHFTSKSTSYFSPSSNGESSPSSPFYIQFQLEEQDSHFLSPSYIESLQRASQVWEFAPFPNVLKRSYSTPSFFIPTMVMLTDNPPVYSCASNESLGNRLSTTSFEIYELGYYRKCFVSPLGTIFDGSIRKSSSCHRCSMTDPVVSTITCARLLNDPIDVIMFGKLEGSYGNRRENTCNRLRRSSISSVCLQNIFGPALNYFVCRAKIVVVEHFHKNSVLETHRIDPLLQSGKIVIATPSSNHILDELYYPVVFVKRRDLIDKILSIISNYDRWLSSTQYSSIVKDFVEERSVNIDPLCHALQTLHANIIAMSAQRGIPIVRKSNFEFYILTIAMVILMFLFVILCKILWKRCRWFKQ